MLNRPALAAVFLLPLTLLPGLGDAPDPASAPPPPQRIHLNVGIAQREKGPEGSLVRIIPFWTYRFNRTYQASDWLIWPLLTGSSRWPDVSEFFSVPLLTYAKTVRPSASASTPSAKPASPTSTWLSIPILSGGARWEQDGTPCSETGILPLLSEFTRTGRDRDTRIVSLWDFTLVRAAWHKPRHPRAGESVAWKSWGILDPLWRGGGGEDGRSYGWLSPLIDYESEGEGKPGHTAILPLFFKMEWDGRGKSRIRPSAAAFERAWPVYLHDRHTGEHHVLWPLIYVQDSPDGDSETLFRPLWGIRRTPEHEEVGIGPTLWPLARGFPSDPYVVGHRLIQPVTVRRAPDASAVNVLWPILFHHGSDLRGSETSALCEFLHRSRRPDPYGGEIRTSRLFPLFSSTSATRSRRTLIFPLLWGWEENDAGRYVRPLLIFKIRTGPPSWAK